MRDLETTIGLVSQRQSTVLIHGETGTGKERVARRIHALSPRAAGPFVAVDCATLRDTLFESQLFGHVKGAFTGAASSTLGFFRAAANGTLFLDEIGELSLDVQARLLRCIQERAVVPLGGVEPVPVDVRIIAATHRDLEQMVSRDEFRSDLYYRLAIVILRVQPLRARRDDVAVLARHFLDGLAALYPEDEEKILTTEAVRLLESYSWPGNVRELANVIEHAYTFSHGRHIGVDALPSRLRKSTTTLEPSFGRGMLAEAERQAVVTALSRANNVRSRAAELLGIDRRRLNRLMQRLGVER